MTPPVDSKGAAIEKILWSITTVGAGMDDYGAMGEEEQKQEVSAAKQAILAILAQEVKRVRLEWFKAGQEDIINHYHHDPEIRRAVKAATLKARKAGLV